MKTNVERHTVLTSIYNLIEKYEIEIEKEEKTIQWDIDDKYMSAGKTQALSEVVQDLKDYWDELKNMQ